VCRAIDEGTRDTVAVSDEVGRPEHRCADRYPAVSVVAGPAVGEQVAESAARQGCARADSGRCVDKGGARRPQPAIVNERPQRDHPGRQRFTVDRPRIAIVRKLQGGEAERLW